MSMTTARILDEAPAEAYGVADRIAPIRKPLDFKPAVQRWSVRLPGEEVRLSFFAAQARDPEALAGSKFMAWVRSSLAGHADGPSSYDHARFTDPAGFTNHVVAAYWVDAARFSRWERDSAVAGWWADPERLAGDVGVWREMLAVPPDRQETIYWIDYPAGLMRSPDVSVYPTPYCGYYGAMRDRLPASAVDPLDAEPGVALDRTERGGFSQRWRVDAPANLAVIRSANTWGAMDDEQLMDYRAKLLGPLDAGMNFLRENAGETGCASLRMQQTTDPDGRPQLEAHALGYFLSLRHMETWAEGHQTHAAIFNAAIDRYKRYGRSNQLRTWHEVYILPRGGQVLEYANCHPATGLLPYFSAERLA